MITVTKFLRKGSLAPAILRQAQDAPMSIAQRRLSQTTLTLSDGQELQLNLESGETLQDGDILLSENNRFFVVRAAVEELNKLSVADTRSLLQAVYQLSQLKVPLQLGEDCVYIEPNTQHTQLLNQLGVTISSVQAPFIPEPVIANNQHQHTHECGHAHHHDCGHDHSHHHGHSCGHDHAHPHAHKHDHSCGHQHTHEHQHSEDCGHKQSHDKS